MRKNIHTIFQKSIDKAIQICNNVLEENNTIYIVSIHLINRGNCNG